MLPLIRHMFTFYKPRIFYPSVVIWLIALISLFLSASAASSPLDVEAANPGVRINEVLAGMNGDSKAQFIEMEVEDSSRKCWGPQQEGDPCYAGLSETSGRAMLLFMDAAGNQTGRYVFLSDPGGDLNTVLVATQAFADLPGAPQPDFLMPPEVMAISGQVCFHGNPDNPNAASVNLCLSYGPFTGPEQPNAAPNDPVDGPFTGPVNGPPVQNMLQIVGTFSIDRTNGGFGDHNNDDFDLTSNPSPQNTAGQTFTLPTALPEEVGRALFFQETFNGNGRTCATCHTPQDHFGLSPATVASLPPMDALFIAEFNLNAIQLSDHTLPSDLRGVVTTSDGSSFPIIAGTMDTYLIYGGGDGLIGQTITDEHGNAGVIAAFATGDLTSLEDPVLMRGGRALIKVNPSGFDFPFVLRTSPSMLNIKESEPFGLSGEQVNLAEFSSNAIPQHYTRRMERVAGLDFRSPTEEEMKNLAEFMSTMNLPADENFDLDRVVTTEAQKRGRRLFFSEFQNGFNCDICHELTSGILDTHENFNTGVVFLSINDPDHDDLPLERDPETGQFRRFSTMQLWGVRFTAPYFHDNSIFTLREAVNFYCGPEFQSSPSSEVVNPRFCTDQNIDDVTALMEALIELPFDFTRSGDLGVQATAQGTTAPQTFTVTNTSSGNLSIHDLFLNGPGADQFVITAFPPGEEFGPGASCTFQAAFDPSTTGLITATLEFLATDFNGVDFAAGVALSGEGVNTPPTISPLSDQSTLEDSPSQQIPFVVGDAETPPGELTLLATSSDPALVPQANVAFGGDGADRYVVVMPAPDQNGTATITVTVADDLALASAAFTLTVISVNDPPSFTPGTDQLVLEDADAQMVEDWATDISPGPDDEAGQVVTFTLANDHPEMFTIQPALSAEGTLGYFSAPDQNGTVVVTVTLQDSGGTENGGQDTSLPMTFAVQIVAVNDAPSFTPGTNIAVPKNVGQQTLVGWARDITAGPVNEAEQLVNFEVENDHPELFSSSPEIAPDGTLRYAPAMDAAGSAQVTAVLRDNGGTANGGIDTSIPATFTITLGVDMPYRPPPVPLWHWRIKKTHSVD